MDRYRLRGEMTDWITSRGYTQTAMLAFNDYGLSASSARSSLKALHGRLDRLALGTLWAKKPLTERVDSITFFENASTNLHFHMLWRAPRFEQKLVDALPLIWEKLVPSGEATNRAIQCDDHIFWYATKQLTDDSYIFSSEFCSFMQTSA